MNHFLTSCKLEYIRWRESLRGQHKFVLSVLFLGILSGFPQILFYSLFPLWLKAAGMKLSALAMFGAVGVFFSFNWVLAPLMDSFSGFGMDRRRFWLLVSQLFLTLFCFALAITGMQLEGTSFFMMSLFLVAIAFCSAAQDVSIDALRIELTPEGREDLLAFGSSLAVIGWYTGYFIGGGIGLRLFATINTITPDANASNWQTIYDMLIARLNAIYDWQTVYYILAAVLFVMMIVTQWVFRHRRPTMLKPLPKGVQWFEEVFKRPFVSFVQAKGWKLTLMIVAFLFLFKIGEAFLGRLSIVFYREVGYTESQIADYAKFVGWAFMIVFTFFGGLVAGRMGVWRGMMIGGIAMASTNLLFAVIALVHPPNIWLLMFTVLSDNFTTAFATVSAVTFISALCDRHYTASQYALFASISAASRTLLASSAGYLVEDILNKNWALFFVLTTVMVIPSLILLWYMRRQPIFATMQPSSQLSSSSGK